MRAVFHPLVPILLMSTSTAMTASSANWQQTANGICQQLTTAAQAYQQHNLQQAHLKAVMAYFQGYDALMEPSARTVFKQSHIFQIEQDFNTFNKGMIDNPTAAQLQLVQDQAQALCTTLQTDAKAMDAQHTTPIGI